jgi:hypothetical protein
MAATAPSLPRADLLARRRAVEAVLTELAGLTARPVPYAVTEALQDLLTRRLSLEEYLRRHDEIQQAFSDAAGPTLGPVLHRGPHASRQRGRGPVARRGLGRLHR